MTDEIRGAKQGGYQREVQTTLMIYRLKPQGKSGINT